MVNDGKSFPGHCLARFVEELGKVSNNCGTGIQLALQGTLSDDNTRSRQKERSLTRVTVGPVSEFILIRRLFLPFSHHPLLNSFRTQNPKHNKIEIGVD